MPCIFLILGCHVLLPVCVQDRLQPLAGSTRGPDWQVRSWVPDQPEARGRGHVSQWDSVQDAQCAVKEQGPGLPAYLSPFLDSGLQALCASPQGVQPHLLAVPSHRTAAAMLDPCSPLQALLHPQVLAPSWKPYSVAGTIKSLQDNLLHPLAHLELGIHAG